MLTWSLCGVPSVFAHVRVRMLGSEWLWVLSCLCAWGLAWVRRTAPEFVPVRISGGKLRAVAIEGSAEEVRPGPCVCCATCALACWRVAHSFLGFLSAVCSCFEGGSVCVVWLRERVGCGSVCVGCVWGVWYACGGLLTTLPWRSFVLRACMLHVACLHGVVQAVDAPGPVDDESKLEEGGEAGAGA